MGGCGLSLALTHRTNRKTPLGFVGSCPGHHFNAVNDWTDTEAQSAASTVVSHEGKVGVWAKFYCLERQKTGHNTGIKEADRGLKKEEEIRA